MKVGHTLIVEEGWLYSLGDEDAIAHVVGTYAVPDVSQKKRVVHCVK